MRKKCGVMRVQGSYTVETAGVMAVVLFTVMILLNTAFHLRVETVGEFGVHELVEKERHAVESIREEEISYQAEGQRWSLEVTAPVYRPEDSLRLWSLAEQDS
jgi:hypothetical protein